MRKNCPDLKIVIAAGGTGGHLFPAQALAFDLIKTKPDMQVLFISPNLSKNPYFQKNCFSYREIASASPYKKKFIQLIKACLSLMQGTIQSLYHLAKIRPKVVIGFGSFHAFPILLAAKIYRIPLILFEPNTAPGKVNRFCSRWSRFTAIHFPCAAKYLKGKAIGVRMPLLRKESDISPKKAREYFNLDPNQLTLLIFGGSQGARAINHLFTLSIEKLLNKRLSFQLIHIVGDPKQAQEISEMYAKNNIHASVKLFEKNMVMAWLAADLSISRAGAGTLAEQIEFGVPGILIPYPYASENHQEQNASFISEEIKGGVKLIEKELTSDQLALTIEILLAKGAHQLKLMKKSLQNFKKNHDKKDFSSAIIDHLGIH